MEGVREGLAKGQAGRMRGSYTRKPLRKEAWGRKQTN